MKLRIFDYICERIADTMCRSLLTYILLLFCMLPVAAGGKTDSIFDVLNAEIGKRPLYTGQKEARIKAVRHDFDVATNYAQQFEAALELFNEYSAYQSDSAYHYALKLAQMAGEHNDARGLALANLSLMDYYTSVGFFKEAYEIKDQIVSRDLPTKYLPVYYNLCNRFYQNIGGYVGAQAPELAAEYHKARITHLDSLISTLEPGTGPYHIAVLEREQIDNPSATEAFEERLRIVGRYTLTEHEKAVQYSLLGRLALELGNGEDAQYYLAQSSIHDIRGNIKETTAAKMLAELLFSDGNVDRSYDLIHIAFDDASFYNSHLRKDETSSIMRMIEVEHHNKLNSTIWQFGILAGGVIIILIVILILLYNIKKKKRQVEAANAALRQKSAEVDRVNNELKDLLGQLKEVTAIKDEYIMQSLYMNSAFVNSVEEKSREAVRMLKDKKYDEIKYLPYNMGIKEERVRIYRSFDKAFLSLFPNFIDAFNALFNPEDHPVEADARELPVEVRIFALLRLGISDTQEVANYLNLSVKTVYVYKTKIKSKSTVDNSEFEARVMAIPKP